MGVLPIRKTAPDTVALTSYYSKMFVTRSDRSNFNYEKWLSAKVMLLAMGGEGSLMHSARMADVFTSDVVLPRIYTIIAKKIAGFVVNDYQFSFDWKRRRAFFGDSIIDTMDKVLDKKVLVPVAKKEGFLLTMDKDGQLFENSLTEEKASVNLGSIETFIGIDISNKPTEVAEVSIFGKEIPLGIVLGYQLGLGNLLATIKAKFRRVIKGGNYNIATNEFAIKFEDQTIIVEKNGVSELILAGFNRFAKDIKRYSVYDFDRKEVYANVLENNGIGVRWIREFSNMFVFWVDHITRDILITMNEPTDLVLLFIRSAELLLIDQSPHQMDIAYMRDKGYERFAGMIYFELMKAVRGYTSRPANAKTKLELNPQAVWMGILQDQSVMPVDQSNPIHSLKEKEEIIYSGSGGRTARSMTESARVFHKSSEGVVSEATKDSGDVATVVYTTADPNYNSLRGTTRRLDKYEGNAAKIISTSALMAAGIQHDDGKRINFVNIQNSQTTHCKHYTPLPARTGYERVLAHRTDELFAKTARTNGTVTALTNNVITVTYEDGEVVSYEHGRRFGTWAGNVIPHDIKTDLKLGDKVTQGVPIVYNTQYFARDTLDPSQVIYKQGVLARIVLWEGVDTLEDSSAISPELAEKLVTEATHIRCIKVPFDLEVRNLVKTNEMVEKESILCTLHAVTGGNSDIFDEEAIAILNNISASTPRADAAGVVNKIEVIYTGDLEEMSSSLRAIAETSDAKIRKFNNQMGKRAVDGYVEPGFRVGSQTLETNTAMIKVYITGDVPMGVGDKAVFAHQMKSVVCRVMNGRYETEDGQTVDGIFGYQSISNRTVLSPELIGTTNTLSVELGKRVIAAYRQKS